jgi:trehalose 6-phosphate phosphatase
MRAERLREYDSGFNAPPRPRRDWAYFFDLDGTLLDLAPSPAEAELDEAARDLLTELYAVTEGAVVLISGRSIADIDLLFPGAGMPVAGQHGLERRDHRGTLWQHEMPTSSLEDARERIAAVVERHDGLLLEYKGLSLALHYRAAPQLANLAHDVVRSLQQELGTDYRVQEGKFVVELKPGGRDKGAAVLEFMEEEPFRGRRPVFVGDDATDEYAFAVVNELDGVSVKVGPGETAARWRLPGVAAVQEWLQRGLRSFRATGDETGDRR